MLDLRLPMDGKKKPKLPMNGRRSLMFQTLNSSLAHNQLPVGPDYLRARAVLRSRTLRMFFCSRSFVTAFFTRSERDPRPAGRTLPMLSLQPDWLSSASFHLMLCEEHLRLETLVFLMALGQKDISCLKVVLEFTPATFASVRTIVFMLYVINGEQLTIFKIE